MIIAAVLVLVILALLSVFQIALASGMPLGRFAWGGQHEKLPKNLRVGSALAPVTYAVIGVFVVSKAGILQVITNEAVLSVGVWVMFAFFAVGTLMNGISRSRPERYIMTPVCIVLAICFFIIARS